MMPSRVLVVGLGSSGLAALRLAIDDGADVVVTDSRPTDQLREALDQIPEGVRTFVGSHPEACLEGIDLVVTSPGVPPRAPILQRARELGVTVSTEVEFAWSHRPDVPLAAITGSNGKSTVTVLAHRMLEAAGMRSVAGGNLGRPASELVMDPGWQAWVLEISSFQSELLTAMRPRVAVLLNLSQDHLERHPSMHDYTEAKRRLFRFQGDDDHAVLNADDPRSAATATTSRRWLFSLEHAADACLESGRLMLHGEPLIDVDQLQLAGRHNVANALAACLTASALGADGQAMRQALTTFQGLDHRHRTVLEAAGVRWVDDSKATNVGATEAALSGYPPGTVHLILGGLGKDQDFSELADSVQRAAARAYVIGADGGHIADALADRVPVERCATLAEATRRARRFARPGDTVLLAPACASFDQFANYSERGRVFAELAHQEAEPWR